MPKVIYLNKKNIYIYKSLLFILRRYWLGSKEGLLRQQFGDLNVFLVVVVVVVVVGSIGSYTITC